MARRRNTDNDFVLLKEGRSIICPCSLGECQGQECEYNNECKNLFSSFETDVEEDIDCGQRERISAILNSLP